MLFYCVVHVLSCVGIVATVWLRVTVPFSTVVTEEGLLASTPLPPLVPPMIKIDPWLMGTTATLVLAVKRKAIPNHVFFVMSRMATSDIETHRTSPPMITGGYECGSNAVSW